MSDKSNQKNNDDDKLKTPPKGYDKDYSNTAEANQARINSAAQGGHNR